MQTQTLQVPTKEECALAIDTKRALFQARICRNFLALMLQNQNLPLELTKHGTILNSVIRDFETSAKNSVPESNAKWLEEELCQEKLNDVATLVEVCMEIGTHETDDIYNEFFGLIVNMIDTVLYGQKHRKKLHFGKYKALFALVTAEVKADTNKEPGQVFFRKNEQCPQGELFLRTSAPESKEEVK